MPHDAGDDPPPPGVPTTERVRHVFSRVATRYDLVNSLTSLGIDRWWRRAAVQAARPGRTGRVLDLCSGTGGLAFAMARQMRPAEVVGTDIVEEMLDVARARTASYRGRTRIGFLHGDAQKLPFKDASFDSATVAFGVRNLPDREANFREVLRILKPGGRYVILEFSRPPNSVVRRLYYWYLRHVVVLVGGLLTRDRDSYVYLHDTIRSFPDQRILAEELRCAGFSRVEWRDMTSGVVALHVAVK